MAKISVAADEALLAHYPAAWPAHVTVRTAQRARERLMLHASVSLHLSQFCFLCKWWPIIKGANIEINDALSCLETEIPCWAAIGPILHVVSGRCDLFLRINRASICAALKTRLTDESPRHDCALSF